MQVKELGGGERLATNNQMEMLAALKAVSFVAENGAAKKGEAGAITEDDLLIHSDSSYLINGITKWVKGWKSRGWITSTKTPVQNRELWERLDATIESLEARGQNVRWQYVGGHIGVKGNERCDVIATSFATGKVPSPALFEGPLSAYFISDVLDISHSVAKKSEKGSDRSRSKAVAYSYVSAVKGVVQVHKTWKECEARVKGAPVARFKKALSAAEEAVLVAEFSR